MEQKLQSWKETLLSQVGREILIKGVIQAIPSYVMSIFKIPENICNKLESLTSRFWWKHGPKGKGVHWMGWKKMTMIKKTRGRALKEGIVGLGKFIGGKSILEKDLRWNVGSGSSIDIWNLRWSPRYTIFNIFYKASKHLNGNGK
ncbi:conserved hypothetical protein [Ricinus communis]|uniref:Reverse transcriptase zinc-binding domain-containing protein n=1 Tax=Ricinus communis TaxID=3988 RepID=B9T5L3_RICCO|nr:conserved hypothetical protein [Ricinus communis]